MPDFSGMSSQGLENVPRFSGISSQGLEYVPRFSGMSSQGLENIDHRDRFLIPLAIKGNFFRFYDIK